MQIVYAREQDLSPADFIDVLRRSRLAGRPVDDEARIGRMLSQAGLIVSARDVETGALAGVARSITDFSFCCYLSDLAVDRAFQGHGIGTRLIEETRKYAGEEAMCLLLAAPEAKRFYQKIGMPAADNAFLYQRER